MQLLVARRSDLMVSPLFKQQATATRPLANFASVYLCVVHWASHLGFVIQYVGYIACVDVLFQMTILNASLQLSGMNTSTTGQATA